MRGFRLIGVSPLGCKCIERFDVQDKRVLIEYVSQDPLTLSFLFKGRWAKYMSNPTAISWFINQAFKGYECKEGRDYKLEFIE